MSRHLLDQKMETARSTGATVIAVAATRCYIQLLMGARQDAPRRPKIEARHIAELLDEAIARADAGT